jgi:hypothetical protein
MKSIIMPVHMNSVSNVAAAKYFRRWIIVVLEDVSETRFRRLLSHNETSHKDRKPAEQCRRVINHTLDGP